MFLQENKYVNLELLELQELLIKAGYLQPEELSEDFSSVGTLGMDAGAH